MAIHVIPQPKSVTYFGGSVPFCTPFFSEDPALPKEGYTIEISNEGIAVSFADAAGKFYAQQTLRQLQQADGTVPCLQIEDAPQYEYRAFMIDSARHKQSVAELKTIIAAAALLKFNHFHWHLTDDQGWRIESKAFPELCQISAYRAQDGFGNRNGVQYGGYFTWEEIRDIVAFCAERQITVIPEVDMPGHMVALLAAYPDLSCTGRVAAVSTHAGIHRDILCAGNPKTYETVFRLLDEICALFPGTLFHIGGDEAPKARWENCDKCKAMLRAQGLSGFEQLQGYFTKRVAAYLREKGKRVITWNESLKSGMLDKDAVVCNWMDRAKHCIDWANAGGSVIEEDFMHYYLDYPYGMTPLKKTYQFDPMRRGLTEAGKKNILGVETPVWTEFIRDFDRLCFMAFPRMLAVAERGWTDPHLLNYQSFAARAEALVPLLRDYGITPAPANLWNPHGIARLRGIREHRRNAALGSGD